MLKSFLYTVVEISFSAPFIEHPIKDTFCHLLRLIDPNTLLTVKLNWYLQNVARLKVLVQFVLQNIARLKVLVQFVLETGGGGTVCTRDWRCWYSLY